MDHLVTDETVLQQRLDALSPPYTLLADCEFVRERTFWPKLGLLQIRVGETILLLDPLALPTSGVVQRVLDGAALTVMHSPSEDLECLLHTYNRLPSRLFDTQLAAAFCGLGAGLSYRALVEQFTGVQLDKAETRSDWLARPLSDAQLRYAADDVLHLQAVYQALDELLDQRGTRAWFEADCAATLVRARQAADPPPHVALDPRTIQRLDARAIARLQCILDWREAEARRLDRPRSWIVDNETAHQLAQAPSGDAHVHQRLFEQSRRSAKHAAKALWDALEHLPPTTATAPSGPSRHETARRRNAIATLQADVASIAEAHGLPPGLLLPRKHVETLVDEGEWPDAAAGWRAELLEDRLRARLRGID